MLDFMILFKIAGAGILLFVLDKVLEASGKKEIAGMANLVGLIIIMMMALSLVGDLLNTVRTMFMF